MIGSDYLRIDINAAVLSHYSCYLSLYCSAIYFPWWSRYTLTLYSNSLLSPRCGTLYGTSYLTLTFSRSGILCTYTGALLRDVWYLGKEIWYQSFALWSKDQHKSSFSKTTLLLLCKGSICASTYSYFSMYSKHLKVSSECQHADIFSCRYADIIVHNQQHF